MATAMLNCEKKPCAMQEAWLPEAPYTVSSSGIGHVVRKNQNDTSRSQVLIPTRRRCCVLVLLAPELLRCVWIWCRIMNPDPIMDISDVNLGAIAIAFSFAVKAMVVVVGSSTSRSRRKKGMFEIEIDAFFLLNDESENIGREPADLVLFAGGVRRMTRQNLPLLLRCKIPKMTLFLHVQGPRRAEPDEGSLPLYRYIKRRDKECNGSALRIQAERSSTNPGSVQHQTERATLFAAIIQTVV